MCKNNILSSIMIYVSKKWKNSQSSLFITGAAKRLGRATAIKIHENDIDIVIHCNNSIEEANKLASELNSKRNDSAFVIKFNLRDFANYENIFADLPRRWSDIDFLINNASTFYPTKYKKHHWKNGMIYMM